MVIAVLGVLAAVVLVAIDPAQQLARGRDSGRKTSVGQLGRAMQAYYTSRQDYPDYTQWQTSPNILVTTGEIKLFPVNPPYTFGAACTTIPYNGFCYHKAVLLGIYEVAIYARMESKSENSKCASGTTAWFTWASANGRAGIVCSVAEPNPGAPIIFL
jgi:type II secretory pathway pseudopilin PulG